VLYYQFPRTVCFYKAVGGVKERYFLNILDQRGQGVFAYAQTAKTGLKEFRAPIKAGVRTRIGLYTVRNSSLSGP
jgi:hypothetical protein